MNNKLQWTFKHCFICLMLFAMLAIPSFKIFASFYENEIIVDGVNYPDIKSANQAIKDGSQVFLGPGTYTHGIHIRSDNVTISGSQNTHFIGALVKGKGSFLVSGDNTVIENIECSEVKASSNNGSCIRQEGKNLKVFGVYFHDSQQGILQNPKAGTLTILYSRFENLGRKGRSHAVYAQGELLTIKDSVFLKSKDQGHEIKARSKHVHIEDTVIASLTGNDSRLIDMSNGGSLTIINSILQQGNSTVNKQAIGFGLEGMSHKRENKIKIHNSLIILEREKGNTFLAMPKNKQTIALSINNNVIVGRTTDGEKYEDKNTLYIDRFEAKLSSHLLPDISSLPQILQVLIK